MHDRNGKPLAIGDKVNVPCVITALQPGAEYCNCTVETVEPMPPTKNKNTITFNTRQVEKAE